MTYLDIIEKFKAYFEQNKLIARVENEDLNSFDLDKSGAYPLALFYVDSVGLNSPTNTFTIQLLILDILDVNNESDQDNEDYIWNQSLAIINNLQQSLRRGDLFEDRLQLTEVVTPERFSDRFNGGLAGWGVQFNLIAPNEMTIC